MMFHSVIETLFFGTMPHSCANFLKCEEDDGPSMMHGVIAARSGWDGAWCVAPNAGAQGCHLSMLERVAV